MEKRRAQTPWHKRYGLTAPRSAPVHGDKPVLNPDAKLTMPLRALESATAGLPVLPEPDAFPERRMPLWVILAAGAALGMVTALVVNGSVISPERLEQAKAPAAVETGNGLDGSESHGETSTPVPGPRVTVYRDRPSAAKSEPRPTVTVTVTRTIKPSPSPPPSAAPTPAPTVTVTVTATSTVTVTPSPEGPFWPSP